MSETSVQEIVQELEQLKQEHRYLRNLLDVTLDKVTQLERRVTQLEGQGGSLSVSARDTHPNMDYRFENIDESARSLIQHLFTEVSRQITRPSFYTWFVGQITNARLTNDELFIFVQNEFGRDWLAARYDHLIREIVAEALQKDVFIHYVSSPSHA